jgi:hypothetical protein
MKILSLLILSMMAVPLFAASFPHTSNPTCVLRKQECYCSKMGGSQFQCTSTTNMSMTASRRNLSVKNSWKSIHAPTIVPDVSFIIERKTPAYA